MSSTIASTLRGNHFVFLAYPAAGHLRPMMHTILNLLAMHPTLHITVLHNVACSKSIADLVAAHASVDVKDSNRLTTITAIRQGFGFGKECWKQMGEDQGLVEGVKGSVVEVLAAMLKAETSVWDQGKGEVVHGLCAIPPAMVVSDSFIAHAWKYVAKAPEVADYKPALPLNLYGSPPISTWIHFKKHNNPRRLGFIKELLEESRANNRVEPDATDEEIQASDEFDVALTAKLQQFQDGVLELPGAPKMFAYEAAGQRNLLPSNPSAPPNEHFFTHFQDQLANRCDGYIISYPTEILEPGALEAANAMYGEKFVSIGAQAPASLWEGKVRKGEELVDEQEREIMAFLDGKEERSVMLIAFGSFFFPAARPDLIVDLIETLLELPTPRPFILALGSPIASISDDLRDQIHASGRGLVTGFVPQYDVLAHPSTGWFLSHGGANSTLESLLSGVPLIFWPLLADQPLIAAQLTLSPSLDLSIELLQVRVGHSLGRPTYRGPTVEGTREAVRGEMRGVWKALDGEEGRRKRREVERVRRELRRGREEGRGLWELGRRGLVEG